MNETPASSALACLTILLPAAAEERVVDWLLGRAGPAVEFSVHPVAARGPLVRLAEGEEHVRGYARRVEVKLIAPRATIDALAAEAQTLLAGTPGGYWVTPVERFVAFDAAPVPPGAVR
jgi:hypothetical protein